MLIKYLNMKLIRLVSLNVRGLRGDKRNTVFNWLKTNKFDICLLQETYCTSEFISKFKKGWDGEIYHCNSDSKQSRGVCVTITLFTVKVPNAATWGAVTVNSVIVSACAGRLICYISSWFRRPGRRFHRSLRELTPS